MCQITRSKRSDSMRTGWTLFYTNQDTPRGNGDHENYFDFVDGKRDRLTVYDLNGKAYTNCKKKAVHVRKRDSLIFCLFMLHTRLKNNNFKSQMSIKSEMSVFEFLIREKGTQVPWWTLTNSNTLLFSKFTDSGNSFYKTNYVPQLDANYG